MEFRIEILNCSVTDLKCRKRFKETLKLKFDFAGIKFKTEKALLGGGDISWQFRKFIKEFRVSSFEELEERDLRIDLCRPKAEGATMGSVCVDLHTLATGPVDHNLPIIKGGIMVGRLKFSLKMEQITEIRIDFREVKWNDIQASIKSSKLGKHHLRPFMKYAYSKHWTKISEGSSKYEPTYSQVLSGFDPMFKLPPSITFKASLKELMNESIVLNLCHAGKFASKHIVGVNLLFRTVIDRVDKLSDDNLVTFKGKCGKQHLSSIEGFLYIRNLPKIAQMKSTHFSKSALHTENGIYDGQSLIDGLTLPKVKILQTDPKSLDAEMALDEKKSQDKEKWTQKIINELRKHPKITKSDPLFAKTLMEDFIHKKGVAFQNRDELIEAFNAYLHEMQLEQENKHQNLIDFEDVVEVNPSSSIPQDNSRGLRRIRSKSEASIQRPFHPFQNVLSTENLDPFSSFSSESSFDLTPNSSFAFNTDTTLSPSRIPRRIESILGMSSVSPEKQQEIEKKGTNPFEEFSPNNPFIPQSC